MFLSPPLPSPLPPPIPRHTHTKEAINGGKGVRALDFTEYFTHGTTFLKLSYTMYHNRGVSFPTCFLRQPASVKGLLSLSLLGGCVFFSPSLFSELQSNPENDWFSPLMSISQGGCRLHNCLLSLVAKDRDTLL